METVEHPIALGLEELKAFHGKAWAHVLGVVNLKEEVNERARTRWEGLGTGCACVWRGQKLVLTAKHVLQDAGSADIAFLPRSATALGWESPGNIEGVVERVTVGIEKVVRCQWEDLAAIVLDGDGADTLNVEFCELPKRLAVDETISGSGSVLIIGFPVDQTFRVSESRVPGHTTVIMACPCESFWGELVKEPEGALDSSYDPDRHLLIRFEPRSEGLRPFGYSGAAVWCDPARREAIWTANPLLLGIQTHTYEKSGLVRAVRASTIRRFLEESL
jgi:hypothetical protein